MSIQCSKSPLVDWFWLINAIISLISLISFDGLELELPEQTTDLPLATDKLYHTKLYRVHLTTYKNLTTLLLKDTPFSWFTQRSVSCNHSDLSRLHFFLPLPCDKKIIYHAIYFRVPCNDVSSILELCQSNVIMKHSTVWITVKLFHFQTYSTC